MKQDWYVPPSPPQKTPTIYGLFKQGMIFCLVQSLVLEKDTTAILVRGSLDTTWLLLRKGLT